MKQYQGLGGLLMGGTVVLLATQPVWAAATQVTLVRINPTAGGMQVVLETQNGDRPQIFTVKRRNAFIVDITNAQLRIPEGNNFRQNNPTPGITSVTVTQIDPNSIRVIVTGVNNSPTGQLNERAGNGISLSFTPAPGDATAAAPATTPTAQIPPQSAPPAPALANNGLVPGQTPTSPSPIGLNPPGGPAPNVLVPNPEITINGQPAPAAGIAQPISPAPPFLPRAVAPPVGDQAVAEFGTLPEEIDLGTAERVPRLLLRDASVREVLSLLARAANLNIAFTESQQTQPGQTPQQGQAATPTETGPRISLDIENEPVQSVFNYVLRISGLEANRSGRTIFVGTRLPNEARNLIIRNVRLNQVSVTAALNFLVGLGAESAISRERLVTSVNAVPVATTGALTQGSTAITQTQTTTETRLEPQRIELVDATPILRGVQVIGDERTNSLTIVGSPRKVDLALAQLTQLDIRRRQVAVNVRVIDIDLLAFDRAGTSFSFGVNDFRYVNQGGVAILNFGRNAPASTNIAVPALQSTPSFGQNPVNANGSGVFNFARQFFIQLQAAISSGNAKVLTDPTLVVQEGQTADVNLTQEVVTNYILQSQASDNTTTVNVTAEKGRAGLILSIKVDRIDDNGFVSLSVGPSISAPYSTASINLSGNVNTITLLQERRVSSGQLRLRDGQTLLISGIIQDQDRTNITKTPILGDIPILGALFRRTERQNSRQEVIVLLTPQILDDSSNATFGYRYRPSPEVQEMLQQQNRDPGVNNQ